MATAAPPAHRTPRPLRRALAAAAALVGLVLVAQGAFVLLDLLSREERTTERTLSGVRDLVVDSDSGEVVVRAGDGPARLRTELTRGLFGGEAQVSTTGGRVRVSTDCPAFGSVTCSARHELRVPPGTAVRVRTGSGDVTVAGVRGGVTARTGSGTIDLERVDGGVTARTGSGDVTIRGAGDTTVRAQTGSGTIDATRVRGETIAAQTGSGDVRLQVVAPPSTLTARTGSGDVELTVPDVAYAVDARTGSGDEDIAVDRDDDAAHELDLETGSGDLIVSRGPPPRR
jgi:hypothetical protein